MLRLAVAYAVAACLSGIAFAQDSTAPVSVATVAPLRKPKALLTDALPFFVDVLRRELDRSAPRPALRPRSQKQATSLRACPPLTSQVRRPVCPPARLPLICALTGINSARIQHYARRNRSRRHTITACRTIARRTSTNEGSSLVRPCARVSELRSVSPSASSRGCAVGETDDRICSDCSFCGDYRLGGGCACDCVVHTGRDRNASL